MCIQCVCAFMSSDDTSESGSEYVPGSCDENDSDVSDEIGVSDDSDADFLEDNEPIEEEGWTLWPTRLMTLDPCLSRASQVSARGRAERYRCLRGG